MNHSFRHLILLSLLACTQNEKPASEQEAPLPDPTTETQTVEEEEEAIPVDPPETTVNAEGEVSLEEDPYRDRKRVQIRQLSKLIMDATGEEWIGNNGQSNFDNYAESLGIPNYITGTQTDMSISILYTKFLGDASKATCTNMINRESSPEAEGRIFFHNLDPLSTVDAEIKANLQTQILRFHGRRLVDDDPVLASWKSLFDNLLVDAEGDTLVAWRNICMTLIQHPDFYTV